MMKKMKRGGTARLANLTRLMLSALASFGLAASGGLGLAAQAADSYPTRPIRMIVPFVAGGGTDLVARLVAAPLSQQLGQQVVVDNRGGAGSVLGTQILSKSAPDGYTLAIADTAFAINASLMEKLPYDAQRDFTFIAILTTSPSLLVANPGLKVRTLQDLVTAARKEPGKFTLGSAGVGSFSHLALEMFKTAAKIDILHVPYKGAGAAIVDVLAGHASLTLVVPGAVLAHVQSGALVPLAITGKKPLALLPNVPTFTAAGYPTVDPESIRFMLAPAGLPAPVLARLTQALGTVMHLPETQTRLTENGLEPELITGRDARDLMMKEITKWRQAVKSAGVKPN